MAWTNISKPSSSAYTDIAKPVGRLTHGKGYATGIIGPPTYSINIYVDKYTIVAKPVTSSWTNISKPT